MDNDTIYLLKNQKNARKTSQGEQEWLAYLNWLRPNTSTPIQTAHSHPDGHARVNGYYPDGLDVENKVIYEFLGCVVHYHHGEELTCPLSKHLKPDSKSPFAHTCREAYFAWKKKEKSFIEAGYSVETMWECQYGALKATCQSLNAFLKNVFYKHNRPSERLVIRQGLRGGRVEAFRLLFNSDSRVGGNKLHYIDKNRYAYKI